MRAVPAVGGMKPASMRMVVDLPAPLGPRKPSTSPRSTVKETSSTAVKPPKRLVKRSISISADKQRSPHVPRQGPWVYKDALPLQVPAAYGTAQRLSQPGA